MHVLGDTKEPGVGARGGVEAWRREGVKALRLSLATQRPREVSSLPARSVQGLCSSLPAWECQRDREGDRCPWKEEHSGRSGVRQMCADC